jgi:hypothetical protein
MHISLQIRGLSRSTISELLLLVGVLATALVYLDVPLWNSVLFSLAVTSQAAFGTVILTRILKGVPASLLLLLGPGLILGGALSFALFQIFARGVIGLVVVVMVGLASAVYLLRTSSWQPLGSERLWILGQLVGLAALAMTWEFAELLPVAIAFFILGFATGDISTTPRWVKQVAVAIVAVVVITPLFFRQEYWWIATDDYQILEVQMRHFTNNGIFAMWGEHDWRKYHWLSHGWGGLLNQLADTPEVFSTLTRVMPIVYCASLAASLILLTATLIRETKYSMALLIPAWAVVAMNRFDWSAPSTGGALSVTAATVSAGLLVLAAAVDRSRRYLLELLILAVAALTKFPSMFGILLFFLMMEVFLFSNKGRLGLLASSIALRILLGLVVMAPLIYLASIIAGGFEIAPVNPRLGSIGSYGVPLALLLLLFSKFWFVIPLAMSWLTKPKGGHQTPVSSLDMFLKMLAPFAIFGLFLEIFIAPINSNGHEYFSSPFYLIASISLLAGLKSLPELSALRFARHRSLLTTSCLVILGLLWSQIFNVERLSNLLGNRLIDQGDRAPLISFVLSDSRTGVAFVVIALLVGFRSSFKFAKPHTVLLPLFLASTILTFSNCLPQFMNGMKSEAAASRPETLYGSAELQAVGLWLKTSTKQSDVIATNYLRDQAGELISDYSLAVWSERTFFVLGPRFFIESQSQIGATRISEEFAETSSKQSAEKLWVSGVRWFVVDTALVARDSWNEFADEKHRIGRFVILRLRNPA